MKKDGQSTLQGTRFCVFFNFMEFRVLKNYPEPQVMQVLLYIGEIVISRLDKFKEWGLS
jgi:hypothetical protein